MKKSTKLNEEQLQAVQHGDGPMLIIAGAGTGKTTVITQRIKHLILEKNISPSEILALTFTEKAAQEMEERVDVALPYGYTQMWISTFHAFCDRILRDEAIHLGLNPAFTLTTEAEAIQFLKSNIFKLNLKYFRPLGNPYKFLDGMLTHFSRLTDEDITSESYLAFAEKLQQSNEIEPNEKQKTLELAQAFKIYEELKAKEGIMDFSDLITNVLKLFRTRKNILSYYQKQFKYILVDEFQDTNFAQNELAILLAGEKENINVVGDDDQAIYRWRGAAIANIIQFRKHFPNCKIVTLTKNYRSTEEILNKSYKLIQFNNPDRLEVQENINKQLLSIRNVKGAPVKFLFASRVENEAELTIQKITELVEKEKLQYKDFAILVRANDHAQPFVRALERSNIPYQFLGPGRLFHQEEIKDLIAYLKVLYNFEDSASLYRVLTMPIFEFEARDIASILNFSKRKNLGIFESLEKVNEIQLPETVQEKITGLVSMIKRHLELIPRNTTGQILYYFVEDSGLLKQYLQAKSAVEEKRAQNIAKFFEKLKTYEASHDDASVFAVVDWIDLSMQLGESPLAADIDWSDNNAVNILTIHSSKGLEFPVVFLVNLVTQRFPTRDRKEQIPVPQELIKETLPQGDFNLQEERRLFYVGMTRAKDFLYFTAAHYYGEGKRERKISPFVYEALGEDVVDDVLKKRKEIDAVKQLSLLDAISEHVDEPSIPIVQINATQVPITFLSYSQISCFDICPLHYKLRYILKIPPQPLAPLSFGTSVHGFLRDYYQLIIKSEKPDEKMFEQILLNTWIDEGYQSRHHAQTALQTARRILTHYISTYTDTTKPPLGVEIPFQFSVGPLKVGGRIDRVDALTNGSIEIIDYKTGDSMPDEKKLKADFQLTFYALAATEVKDAVFNKKAEEVSLSLFYLDQDKKLTTIRTAEQLENAKQLIKQKAEEIAHSDFSCKGGIACKNCEYKMICQTYAS